MYTPQLQETTVGLVTNLHDFTNFLKVTANLAC